MKLQMETPPKRQSVGWWPLVFSLFVVFLFLDPFQRHASGIEWALTTVGVAAFLVFFCVAIASWHRRVLALGAIGAVALLGFIFAPFNLGAAIFIIYATSFVPYAVGGNGWLSAAFIGLILAIVGVESWLLDLKSVFWIYSSGYAVILGTGNTWAARQSFPVERAPKISAGYRLARDLHEVLV